MLVLLPRMGRMPIADLTCTCGTVRLSLKLLRREVRSGKPTRTGTRGRHSSSGHRPPDKTGRNRLRCRSFRGCGEARGGRRSRLCAALRACGGQHLYKSALCSRHFGADGFHWGRIAADYFIVWVFYRGGHGAADGVAVHSFWSDVADGRRGGDCPGARTGASVYGIAGDGAVRNGDRLGARVDAGDGASGCDARDGDRSEPQAGNAALACCAADGSIVDGADGFYWLAGRVRGVGIFLASECCGILATGD